MNTSPTDEKRALARNILLLVVDESTISTVGIASALLAESEEAAIQKAMGRMDEEELKPCIALVDELHSKIKGWALSLPEDFHWDWLRNEMLASLPKQPEEPKL